MSSTYHSSVTALIQALMSPEGRTYDELVMFSQMSEATVRAWIKAWREASLVNISGWSNDVRGYPTIQRFGWNPGAADVPCPAMTTTERVKAWKARKKAEVQA